MITDNADMQHRKLTMRIWQAFFSTVFIFYVALVGWLSLAGNNSMPDIRSWDKLAHAMAYFGFAILSGTIARRHWQLLVLLFGCACYGLLMEYLQSLTTYRQPSLADMLANITGLATGYMLLQAVNYLRPLPACQTGSGSK